MAVIEDIPNEILSEIFSYLRLEYVLPDPDPSAQTPPSTAAQAPRPARASIPLMSALSLVCKRFYRIASRQLREHIVLCSPYQFSIYELVAALSAPPAFGSASRSKNDTSIDAARPKIRTFSIFPRRHIEYNGWDRWANIHPIYETRELASLRPLVQDVYRVEVCVYRSWTYPRQSHFPQYTHFLRLLNPVHFTLFTDHPPWTQVTHQVDAQMTVHSGDAHDFPVSGLAKQLLGACSRLETLDIAHVSFVDFESRGYPSSCNHFIVSLSGKNLRRMRLVQPKDLNPSLIVDILEAFQNTLDPGGFSIVCRDDWRSGSSVQSFESGPDPLAWFEARNEGTSLAGVISELESRGSMRLLKYLKWEVGL